MIKAMQWDYKTKDGNIIGQVIRLDCQKEYNGSKSRKQIIPYFNKNTQSGIPKDFPAQYRIYGLDRVTDYAKPIFICEGEKCAYALQGLGLQALTTLGGCGQIKLVDWLAIQEAQHIYILPDNDASGLEYAKSIYQGVKDFKNLSEIKLLWFSQINKGDICDFSKIITPTIKLERAK